MSPELKMWSARNASCSRIGHKANLQYGAWSALRSRDQGTKEKSAEDPLGALT